MLDYINGKVMQKGLGYVVVECNDIGYKLLVSQNTSYELNLDQINIIYTHLVVKEDAISLIGFSSITERDMFERLISISKIGAKTALSILSVYTPSDVAKFIKSSDIVSLSKISGLGKKTAERLILELKDKVDMFVNTDDVVLKPNNPVSSIDNLVTDEAAEALMMLGFTAKESQNVVQKAYDIKQSEDVQDIIKTALSLLKK